MASLRAFLKLTRRQRLAAADEKCRVIDVQGRLIRQHLAEAVSSSEAADDLGRAIKGG